jgi:peptide/nickel transport system substrate-binding protein
MQKRLSTKDFILYAFLTLIVILIIATMYQIDRQWTKLSETTQALSAQAKDIGNLRVAISKLSKKVEESGFQLTQTKPPSSIKSTKKNNNPDVIESFKRAYAATQLPDYAMGDWKVDAFANNLKTISPLVSTDAYAATVQNYVLESLLTRDPDTLEWSGLLAKSWHISEDGLTITFQIRKNIVFSDGKPLTSKDVVFSYNFMMNKGIKAPGTQAYYEPLKSVTANGDYEVSFIFKRPYFEAIDLAGGMAILPKHFYQPYMEKTEEYNESKGLLIGTGPYRLSDPKSWTPDKGGVELVRNTRYWGAVQAPYDKIIWKIIQNDSARLTTYRNGELDFYGARPVEYKKLKADKQIMENSHNFEYMSPTAGYSYIGWNQGTAEKPTIFADKRVRQAMTYITDRTKIIDDIYLGYGEIAISPFSPRSKQHDTNLVARKSDLKKAKQLLAEAGFKDSNGDGLLEGADGKDFEFELTYFQGNEDTKRMVLLLKDMYAKAGIKLIPTPTEWPVMIDKLDNKDFMAITLGWTSGIETDIYQMFHSSQTKTNGNNFINYKNDELDKLIDEARKTVDESKRMALWKKAEAIFYEDQPYTFLKRSMSLVFIDKRYKNLSMTKLGLNTGMLPLETYVPKANQKYH